jgi:hypothetical protein
MRTLKVEAVAKRSNRRKMKKERKIGQKVEEK